MADSRTFQQALEDLLRHTFVGRQEQLSIFDDFLRSPSFLILAIAGQAGMGKTTLLDRFCQRAEQQGAIAALSSPEGVLNTLDQLSKDCLRQDAAFDNFRSHYERYRRLTESVRTDPSAPRDLSASLSAVTEIGIGGLDLVAGVKEVKRTVLGPDANRKIADQVGSVTSYLFQRFKSKEDYELLVNPERELSRHFVSDLNDTKQRLLLMLDSYERRTDSFDAWLRDFIIGTFGKFGSNISFVIAGRMPLGQAWGRFRQAIHQTQLREFGESEVRQFLVQAGVTDLQQIDRCIRLTYGVPVLLALVSRPGSHPAEVSGNALDCFLEGASREQREASLAASVPRVFNEDVLRVVISDGAELAFENLTALSFVQSRADGWAYHDVVRSLMIRHLRLKSPTTYRELHARLAAHYGGVTRAQSSSVDQAPPHRAQVEGWYHHLSILDAAGLAPALSDLRANLQSADAQTLWSYAKILAQVSIESDVLPLETWENALDQSGLRTLKQLFQRERRGNAILEQIHFNLVQGLLEDAEPLFQLAVENYVDETALQPLSEQLVGLRAQRRAEAFQQHIGHANELMDAQNFAAAMEELRAASALLPDDQELATLRSRCALGQAVLEALNSGDVDNARIILDRDRPSLGGHETFRQLESSVDAARARSDWPDPLEGLGLWHPGSWALPATSVSLASALALCLDYMLLANRAQTDIRLLPFASEMLAAPAAVVAFGVAWVGRHRIVPTFARLWPLVLAVNMLALTAIALVARVRGAEMVFLQQLTIAGCLSGVTLLFRLFRFGAHSSLLPMLGPIALAFNMIALVAYWFLM